MVVSKLNDRCPAEQLVAALSGGAFLFALIEWALGISSSGLYLALPPCAIPAEVFVSLT